MKMPPIVPPQEWEAARQEQLVKEKQLTRTRDALAAERRRMPWVAVERQYRFEGQHVPLRCAVLERTGTAGALGHVPAD